VLPGGSRTEAAEEVQRLRPEIGKPLQQAEELLKLHRLTDASAQVVEADKVGDKTAYESFVIERIRGAIANAEGDNVAAAKSYEAQLESGRVAASEQLKLVMAVASIAYQVKDYPKAVAWVTRYFQQGGNEPMMRTLLIQAYFLQNDYADAGKAQVDQIEAEEKDRQTPMEEQFQLLATCQERLKDDGGFTATMEKLVIHYPKKEYWAQLIHRMQIKPGFASGRLALDVQRLALAVGTLSTSTQYMEMVQRALQGGLVGEAKTILDAGYAAGILGTGPDAARAQRLKDLVTRTLVDDQQSLSAETPEAAARDAEALFTIGAKYVGYGQFDKGISAMEQAVGRGGLKRPDDARLHLGLAYLAAGQKTKAAAMFRAVGGNDGVADLGHLWVLQTGGN
jgi:tetratricopeptide (TPR) repeat protein